MEKQIRSELIKMTVMMLVLLGLGIYAHEFVIAGVKAKVALNLSIFAIFGLAAWLAFQPVFGLKNEILALKALQTDYIADNRRQFDPYKQPAIVFSEPKLLGQSYRLITEELSKQNELTITNTTVQSLIHDVDQRINERKSTILYFSGLMVFLGLLGAFMGLMKTVHSVGDLIGSMDMSGGGGEDSFGKLIEGMKGPLNGMSVGFSSSLFGLMTSMVLGALERCMTSALKALRNEFEHWLSNLAQIEKKGQSEAAGSGGSAVVLRALAEGGKQLQQLRESILSGARTSESAQTSIAQLAQSMEALTHTVDRVVDPVPLLRPIAEVVGDLARNQTTMVAQFQTLYDLAERDRATMRQILDEMRTTAATAGPIDGAQLHAQLERLVELQADRGGHAPALPPEAKAQPASRFASLLDRILPGPNASAFKREQRILRGELRNLLANQKRSHKYFERSLVRAIGALESGRSTDHAMVSRMLTDNEDYKARIAALVDHLQTLDANASAPDAASAELTGARLELDVLRRRLQAPQETSDNTVTGSARSATRKSTGTTGN